MSPDELTCLTLRDIADAIAKGEVTSLEVAQACIDRARRLHPTLNCFILLEADRALEEAARADERLRAGECRGPLHGIPLAHKDVFNRRGRTTTCGSPLRADFIPETTATVLERLDAAGALDLGTLNLGEFAASGTGHNAFYGNCRNPWNVAYTPGGSSSGSAAAVAARIVYGSMGTDTSGSLRWPAFLCGISALRPTKGAVSSYGVLARSWTIDAVGPLARTVADVATIYVQIAGDDPRDPECFGPSPPDLDQMLSRDTTGIRLGIPRNYFYEGVASDVGDAIEQCHGVFERLGITLVPVTVPEPEAASDLADLIVKCESSAIHQQWLLEKAEGYSPFVRSQLLPGFFVPAPAYIQALRLRHGHLVRLMTETFSEVNMLLLPGAPVSPPTLAQMDLQTEEEVRDFWSSVPRCTRPISYWGLPALSVPCGFNSGGLPLGFQLVGPPNSEADLICVGHAFQAETDWHLMSPPRIE